MKNYLDSIDRAALRSRAEQMLHTAGNACDQAGRFMNTTTEKIRGFSLIEFFIYETCLLSFGLWLGTCFSKFFKKFRAIIFNLRFHPLTADRKEFIVGRSQSGKKVPV